jgi:hypothetical protein
MELKYSNRGYAYPIGSAVLAEYLDMFRLRPIVTGGNTNPSGNLSFTKIPLVGWMSGNLTQRDGIASVEDLVDSWGNHFL